MKRIYFKPETILLDETIEINIMQGTNVIVDPNGNNQGSIDNGGDNPGVPNFSREDSFFEDDDF